MEASKVYFTSMRTTGGKSLLQKLEKLICEAGIGQIDFEKKFTAIKVHFGEPGNLSFLRPNYVRTVADTVRALGGKPFVTDCNTLYVGRRKDALEHLEAAQENGFSPASCGCQIIIADGLKGTDEALVPLTGTEFVKEAKIGRSIMDADVYISLNHFKGHEMTGFGGALKNTGMGCGSRAGKMEQHAGGKPTVDASLCRGCGACARACAHGAIAVGKDRKAAVNLDRCVGCGRCLGACNFDAVDFASNHALPDFNKRMAEYALAVVQGRPSFHINIVTQVSPHCDCYGSNDIPIIPDVGMFASFDPVAVDAASADACNNQQAMPGSALAELAHTGCSCEGHDHFSTLFPETDWRVCLAHAEKIGVGQRAYELITVE